MCDVLNMTRLHVRCSIRWQKQPNKSFYKKYNWAVHFTRDYTNWAVLEGRRMSHVYPCQSAPKLAH